jgi:hypothetical protein
VERERMQRGCALLFCELHGTPQQRLSNACLSVDPESKSHAPIEAGNTLCRRDPAEQLVLGTATATSICRAAGFDPALGCSARGNSQSAGRVLTRGSSGMRATRATRATRGSSAGASLVSKPGARAHD